jgi:hypothetical protein
VDAGEAGDGILVAKETCDEGEKTSVGCGDDFGCFRLILVVLEYAFQLISVWAMAVPTLPTPMTEILVWLLVGDGGAALWSDREGEHRLHWILAKVGTKSLAAYDGVEVGDSGGDQQR